VPIVVGFEFQVSLAFLKNIGLSRSALVQGKVC
jgi:hypothetical protein